MEEAFEIQCSLWKLPEYGDYQDSLAWRNGYTMEFLSSVPGSSGKKSYEQRFKIAKKCLITIFSPN